MFNAIASGLQRANVSVSSLTERGMHYCPAKYRPLLGNVTLTAAIGSFITAIYRNSLLWMAAAAGTSLVWREIRNNPLNQLLSLKNEIAAALPVTIEEKTALTQRLKTLWFKHQNSALKPYKALVQTLANALKDNTHKAKADLQKCQLTTSTTAQKTKQASTKTVSLNPSLKKAQPQAASVKASPITPTKALSQAKIVFDKLVKTADSLLNEKQIAQQLRKEIMPYRGTRVFEVTSLLYILDLIISGKSIPLERRTVAFKASTLAYKIQNNRLYVDINHGPFQEAIERDFPVKHAFGSIPFNDKYNSAVKVIHAEIGKKKAIADFFIQLLVKDLRTDRQHIAQAASYINCLIKEDRNLGIMGCYPFLHFPQARQWIKDHILRPKFPTVNIPGKKNYDAAVKSIRAELLKYGVKY